MFGPSHRDGQKLWRCIVGSAGSWIAALRSQRRCQFSDPSAIAANPKKSPVTYQATGLFLKRQDFLEEREGFEPSEPYGSPDFESGTFDHSATSPVSIADSSRPESRFRLLALKELSCRPCRAATPPEYRHCRRRAGSFRAQPPGCVPRPGLSRSAYEQTRSCLARS